jgi:hypothetical protein
MEGVIKLEIAAKYGNFGAKSEKTGKLLNAYQDCTETWSPPISKRTGTLITGLSEKEESFFEDKLGFERGHLRKSSEFWYNFKIKVPAEGVQLDLSDDYSMLKYTVLKSDPEVATSKTELKNNPYCQFVMIRESEKADNESEERKVKIQSYGILHNLTSQDYQDIYLMIKNSNPVDVHDSIIKNDVEKYVEKMPKQFVALFTDKNFKDKVLLTKMIQKRIISKQGRGLNSPLYFNDVFLGNNVEEAMSFLKDPKNNSIFIEILRQNKSNSNSGSEISLSSQINSFESKKEALSETDKLQREIQRLELELKKKSEYAKSQEGKTTEEYDASKVERAEDGFSSETAEAAETIEEVESEIVEKPKRGRRTTKAK